MFHFSIAVQTYSMGDHRLHLLRYLLQRNLLTQDQRSLDEQHRSRQLALPAETSLEDVGSEQEPCPTHHVALPAEMHLEEVYSCSSSEEASCADQGAHNSASSTSDAEQYLSDDGTHEESHPFDSDSLNVKVCNCVSTTVADVLVLALAYVSRHKPTTAALLDLLLLINTIFQSSILPTTQYLFRKVFPVEAEQVSHHLYCPKCSLNLGRKTSTTRKKIKCTNCNTQWNLNDIPSLIMLPLGPQIRFLLENNPSIQQHLSYRTDRTKSKKTSFDDILDGAKYKSLSQPGQFLSSPNNFSYTFNTDGAQVFKSAKTSAWPIHVMINELPPRVRQKHMLLAGLWCGKGKPDMNTFLGLFVNDAKKIFDGVKWKNNSGTVVRSRFVGLCCCVDSVARAPMQNHVGFHGYFGCSWCYHKGEYHASAIRFPITIDTPMERTDDMAIREMQQSLKEKRHPVCGFKGPAALINMPHFGIVSGFVPDYMHAVLLGVVRTITGLWLSEAKERFYIGKKSTTNIINSRIIEMSPPSSVSRLPRDITEHRFWKASEWKAWLLYYVFPCLHGILHNDFLQHFALLSRAVFLLLQGSISRAFNVHCLGHLTRSVVDFGPLWAHSGFPFETANGLLRKLFKERLRSNMSDSTSASCNGGYTGKYHAYVGFIMATQMSSRVAQFHFEEKRFCFGCDQLQAGILNWDQFKLGPAANWF
ncbi:uncharacterized protein LOC135387660 [Ornithodoros turicata]|uniref:uncharacterized protein LOC135387660 n=1 Tax=Ornithodoros turicata TaxID=34597 RepID=UPI003138E992